MSRVRINRFSNPERGGRQVEALTFVRKTIVIERDGITHETTQEWWKDIGTIMPPVQNHIKEQPTNKWKQRLIDAQRKQAGVDGHDDRI